MYARIRIIVERKPDSLIIPADALVAEKTRNSVFTVADNKAHRVTAKTVSTMGLGRNPRRCETQRSRNPCGKQVLVDGQPVTVTSQVKLFP